MYDLLIDTIGVKWLNSLLGHSVGPLEDNEKKLSQNKTENEQMLTILVDE